jgi:4'-phosphopantetheinyl transferase
MGGMALVEAEVAYWDLARQRSRLPALLALLSPEENARAERLAIPVIRERFVLRHGILRETLGAMIGASPAALRFDRRPDGKPVLAGDGDLAFNLSKSDDGLLIATARGGTIGCDLERLRPNSEAKSIASRWFNDGEREALRRLEGEAFDRAFTRLWVRKEAVLKAAGTGMQSSLGVDTGDPEPAETAGPVVVEGREFWLADFEPVPGWIAAVAADRPMTVRLAVHV